MKYTAHEFLKAVHSYHANLSDGDTQGVAVDTRGFSECLVILDTGVFAGTAPTLDVAIQSGDLADGSDGADITGADFTQVTTTNDDALEVGRINLEGKARYIRPDFTTGGTTPTGELCVVFVLLGAKELPTGMTAAFEV